MDILLVKEQNVFLGTVKVMSFVFSVILVTNTLYIYYL